MQSHSASRLSRPPGALPALFALFALLGGSTAVAAVSTAPPLDPVSIPKYVTPLVIPPEMPRSTSQPCTGAGCPAAAYNLSMRQFRQQVLPGGAWNSLNGRKDAFPATTVWGYGRTQDPVPAVAPAPAATTSFNYPSFTVENLSNVGTTVRWINELVAIDPATGKPYAPGSGKRTWLSHIVPTDPTLHWANPGKAPCLPAVPGGASVAGTDCLPDPARLPIDPATGRVASYSGPVPMVTHVHGAEVGPESDGYAEAWWLPQADNIPAGFAAKGREYDQNNRANALPGSAFFAYPNSQPATTLWYHDHSLGITRDNVYAGPAGFWMVRSLLDVPACSMPGGWSALARPTSPNSIYTWASVCLKTGISVGLLHPGCDPNFDLACRAAVREIPLAIQDRSFRSDGSLFYSTTRDDANPADPGVALPYAPASDIAPIINPEFFATAITVNGTTWPTLQVASQRYRFRILDGSDARSFNLALWSLNATQQAAAHKLLVSADGVDATLPNAAYTGGVYNGSKTTVNFPAGTELPIYQIGAEQGYLPKVVKIMTGRMAVAPGFPSYAEPALPTCVPASEPGVLPVVAGSNPQDPDCVRGLLITPAERADTIVDFSALAAGTTVRMVNTAQDSPFQGFPIMDPPPMPGLTDQIMEFQVVSRFTTAANPTGVVPPADPSVPAAQLPIDLYAEAALVAPSTAKVRALALAEFDSQQLCGSIDPVTGNITGTTVFPSPQTVGFDQTCAKALPGGMPFGPRIDMLGQVTGGTPLPFHWADPITQTPTQNAVQEWDIYNFTPDAHPMHLHGTRFQIIGRDNLVADPASGTAAIPVALAGHSDGALPTEKGYKDTLVALPRQRTRILASFPRTGLYQWHCHITEHEDNEMMLPMCVVPAGASPAACAAPSNGTGTATPPAVPISAAAR